jgi:transposase
MLLLRYLQHWLTGRGPCLQVADFVPETHPIRQWADTVPWATLVAAVDRSFTRRFPKPTARGRPPVSTRVLLALELLKHELACSDEQICSRLRTDLAVMYACGITQVQVDGSQEHFVLPEVLAQFRSRLDAPLMEELLAIQAATAMEEGLVSPAHVVVDTFPSEQGSQRVNEAATLYKAQKQSSRSSRPSPPSAPPRAQRCRPKCSNSGRTSRSECAASVVSAEGWGRCL